MNIDIELRMARQATRWAIKDDAERRETVLRHAAHCCALNEARKFLATIERKDFIPAIELVEPELLIEPEPLATSEPLPSRPIKPTRITLTSQILAALAARGRADTNQIAEMLGEKNPNRIASFMPNLRRRGIIKPVGKGTSSHNQSTIMYALVVAQPTLGTAVQP